MVADWTRTQTAVEIVNTLGAQHVPAEQVLTPDRMYDIPQLDARGFYEEVEHPVTGAAPLPGLAIQDDARPQPPPPVRAADAWAAQRGDPAGSWPNR